MKTLSTIVKEINISIEDFLKDPAAAAERYVRAGMEEGIHSSVECIPSRSASMNIDTVIMDILSLIVKIKDK